MKILHTADLRAGRESAQDFFLACESILQTAYKYEVSLIAISGNMWDGPMQNAAGSLFPDFVEAIRVLGTCTPVALIYGAPIYDIEGSLEIFEAMECIHGIKILKPGMTYILKSGVIEELLGNNYENAELLISGIPGPSRHWLVPENNQHSSLNADIQASEAFTTLCTATGCMRERYSRLPSLVLAHGLVEGAKQLQGLKLAERNEIHFTKESLKALRAEYIALGGIHQPQHIEGTRAWYAGSAYPLSFGESQKAGCWIVDIHGPGEPVDVTRVEFPHPTRKHLISHASCAMEVPSIKGQKVWYEIKGTKKEIDPLDPDIIMSRLLGHGALEGSMVTFNVHRDEPAYLEEMRVAHGIEEKLKVWAQIKEEKLSQGLLEKVRNLIQESTVNTFSPAKTRYRIDRLLLRGAKGIWAKSRKDEIDLDLSELGSGIISLISSNGSGSTTILENLHPWPRLLSMEGPLDDRFRLPDSFRDLYLMELNTGWKYRCLIKMHKGSLSGDNEYWLFRETATGYAPLEGIDGKLEPYLEWTGRLFGSIEVFKKTVFRTQRNVIDYQDLLGSSEEDRSDLLHRLCDIGWLEAYSRAAKKQTDAVSRAIKEVEARHSLLIGTEERCASLRNEIEQYAATVDERSREGKKLERELGLARGRLSEALENSEDRSGLVRERERAFNEIMALKGKQRGITEIIESHRAGQRLRNKAEKSIEKAGELSKKKDILAAALKIGELVTPLRSPKRDFPEKDELVAIEKELEGIDLKWAYDTIQRADEAESIIGQAREELAKIEEKIGAASKTVEDCGASLALLPPIKKEAEAKKEVKRLEASLCTVNTQEAQAQEGREESEKALKEEKSRLDEYTILSEKLKNMTVDLCEWAFLERAAGRDGIQALELDALLSSLSGIASRFLTASGNDGHIIIQASPTIGRKTRQQGIGDLQILYTNAKGEEQEFSTLSSSETLFIGTAIYHAIEVIYTKNTGVQFCTAIIDEADGALDRDSRLRYVRMIETEHRESGRYQTIIATQSQEIRAVADKCIDIRDLQPRVGALPNDEDIALCA